MLLCEGSETNWGVIGGASTTISSTKGATCYKWKGLLPKCSNIPISFILNLRQQIVVNHHALAAKWLLWKFEETWCIENRSSPLYFRM